MPAAPAARVAHGHAISGYVARHHAARPNDRVVVDAHAGQHNDSGPQPYVVPDADEMGKLPARHARPGLYRVAVLNTTFGAKNTLSPMITGAQSSTVRL